VRRRFSSQFLGMNSTVVYAGDSAHIIDPGVFPAETARIHRFLEKAGIEKITILLTHTHGDHISGWHDFRQYRCFGHESIARKSDAMRDNDVKYLKGMWRKQGLENVEHLIFPNNIEYLPDDDFRNIAPAEFAFFHVPGHSVDMSAIVIPGEHLLFSGDMLIQAPTPFVLRSTRRYWKSLRIFRDLVSRYKIACLIPGHGKPAKSRQEILERIRSEQQYMQKLIWEGIKLARSGAIGEELKSQLFRMSERYVQLHSHQANVQTFLRELDDWLSDENLDLEIY
jgi:hydroxyacylglutathione hydrolase